ncbi:olfactory receptor 6P1-like [Harpia harpyja]|uniref:olfactory receptor 6P1-like n=1 Tax=Harpia harpyja TaxID=202280 RepID=UPI0022B0D6E9|nr:olfactory receptor 6P1-like [Harpia harpyja]
MVFVLGKNLIIMRAVANQHLCTPMGFFLGHWSSLEIFYRSTTLPQLMASFMTGDSSISAHHGFRVVSCSFCKYRVFTAGDYILRSVLGCVTHPALCRTQELPGLSPLLGGFLSSTVIISVMSQIQFCGPSGVDHFFCDFTPLLELSHTDTVTLMLFAVMTCFLVPTLPFLFTWSSCVHQSCHPEEHLPSGAGRQKDFST